MFKVVGVVLLELLGLVVTAQTTTDRFPTHRQEPALTELVSDPFVRATCHKLLASARFGFASSESAAFIVRNADGSLAVVRWPPVWEKNSQLWEGRFPTGTLAILHTHQNWLPQPSSIDCSTARQKHIPVYVITWQYIFKTDGGPGRSVAEGWY